MIYTPTMSAWHHLDLPAWCGLFTSQFQGAGVVRDPQCYHDDDCEILVPRANVRQPAHHGAAHRTGGNGKSTIIEFLMSFWDQKDIGVIPNNAQKTFPFEQAINYFMKCAKPCIVFPRLRATRRSTWPMCCDCVRPRTCSFSTERIRRLSRRLARLPYGPPRTSSGARTSGGSASRRTLLVRLPNQIRKSQADGKLAERLRIRERAAVVLMASYDFATFVIDTGLWSSRSTRTVSN